MGVAAGRSRLRARAAECSDAPSRCVRGDGVGSRSRRAAASGLVQLEARVRPRPHGVQRRGGWGWLQFMQAPPGRQEAAQPMWYVIEGYDGADVLAHRLQARPEHLARLTALRDQGRLLLAGPCPAIDAEDPGPAGFSGSVVIAEFESLEAARAWAAGRPLRGRRRLPAGRSAPVPQGPAVSAGPLPRDQRVAAIRRALEAALAPLFAGNRGREPSPCRACRRRRRARPLPRRHRQRGLCRAQSRSLAIAPCMPRWAS